MTETTETKTYTLRDNGVTHTIEATSPEDAHDQARDWARAAYTCSHGEGTYWVTVHITGEDDYEDSVKVTIDPEAPACARGEEHDWQTPFEIVGGIRENPGVRGNGGGVIMTEVCMHCGCERRTDTWATDPVDGTQGHEAVSYEAKKYVDELAALADSASEE